MISSKGLPGIFIFNKEKGKESWIAERQRESLCERQSFVIEEK
jgi:hypothetical protein